MKVAHYGRMPIAGTLVGRLVIMAACRRVLCQVVSQTGHVGKYLVNEESVMSGLVLALIHAECRISSTLFLLSEEDLW